MKRRYPELPITAVAGVVFDEKKRVLLAKRGRAPAKDKWSFPGGVVNIGENLEDALKRELLEETGLEVDIVSLLDVSSRIIKDDDGKVEYHYILLDYLCLAHGTSVKVATDILAAEWVSIEDLSEYDTTGDAERVIRKGLEAI